VLHLRGQKIIYKVSSPNIGKRSQICYQCMQENNSKLVNFLLMFTYLQTKFKLILKFCQNFIAILTNAELLATI
jgi:hypothetical protein